MRTSCGKQFGWMASTGIIAIVSLLCLSLVGGSDAQSFSSLFNSYGGPSNVRPSTDGNQVQIVLDQYSASGFGSKKQYLFGSYGLNIKLVPNNSAGTVTTFYISSQGANHDEFDFEFLGNLSGQPYILHTNIFSNGVGGREIQYTLWFDPTAAFHYYQVQWNQDIAVFYVDNTPIRMFLRNETIVPYPNKQPMNVYASIWDGSQWATQGGAVKINWAAAPFIATYQDFSLIKGCVVNSTSAIQTCQNSKSAKPGVGSQTLNTHRQNQLKWVKKYHIHYNYCTDKARYPIQPPECKINIL